MQSKILKAFDQSEVSSVWSASMLTNLLYYYTRWLVQILSIIMWWSIASISQASLQCWRSQGPKTSHFTRALKYTYNKNKNNKKKKKTSQRSSHTMRFEPQAQNWSIIPYRHYFSVLPRICTHHGHIKFSSWIEVTHTVFNHSKISMLAASFILFPLAPLKLCTRNGCEKYVLHCFKSSTLVIRN